MLLLKKEYFQAVRVGTKRTTLRYWRSRRVRPGSIHLVPGLGKVHILEARPVQWSQLTDADAQADGFGCLSELRQKLEEIYPPEAREARRLYQVHFDLLRVKDQA